MGKKTSSQQSATQSAPAVEQPAPVVVEQSAAPVVEQSAAPVQKSKKTKTPVAVQEPAQEPVQVAAVESAPKRRGKSQQAAAAQEPAVAAQEPAAAAQESAPAPVRQRKQKTSTGVADAEPKQKRRKQDAVVAPVQDGGEEQVVNGRRLRSFKVKLPNSTEYEGRFTGLTPYQAANKALSKFFREATTDQTDASVTFSICESTRNSKKSVYTYVGGRVKLAVPVKYSIDGGREITKHFKNSLKKVKKNEQQQQQ